MDLDEVEKCRTLRPPIYPSAKKGTILRRDMRLWHAGMPSKTETPRRTIDLSHTQLVLSSSPSFDPLLHWMAQQVDGDV